MSLFPDPTAGAIPYTVYPVLNRTVPGRNNGTGIMTCSFNSTELDAESREILQFERVVGIIAPILFGFITVVGIVGNVLVIMVVVSNKQMRNTTNLLIMNLAIADLSFIVMCVPFTATIYALTSWPFGAAWCKIYQYTIYVSCYVSVYTLVLMSLDRYLAVVHPITSMSIRNQANAIMVTLLTWAVICISNVPILVKFKVYYYDFLCEMRSTCVDPDILQFPQNGQAFYGSLFVCAFLVPLTVVSILYGLMLKRLLYGVAPRVSQSSESQRSKRRVTRMVVVVVAAFAICWLPIQVMFMIQYFGKDPAQSSTIFIGIRIASHCLAYMNSCINPILYAFLSDNFRKSFMKLLCNKSMTPSRFEFERTNAKCMEASKSTGVTDNCV